MSATSEREAWERPKWVKELRTFLTDTLIDHIDPDGADDELTDAVELAAMSVVCGQYGHGVVDDHCGIPEHRYCCWCGQMMPNIEPGNYHPEATAP
jgi:hypothetical protein